MSIQIPKDITLNEGEIPIWYGKITWTANFLLLLVGLICFFTIVLFFITIICLIIAWINVKYSEYFISNKRIYSKHGFLNRTSNEIKIDWVTNVYFQQGIVGRTLNFGNIGVSTPGEHGGAVEFNGIADPLKVKAIVEDTLEKNKKKS